jgi:protein-disulfide isomerase
MTKEKSNRQLRREKMRQSEMRSRMVTILLIVVGVSALVFMVVGRTVMDSLQPPEAVKTPKPIERTQVDGTNIGDPNAKAKIEVFEDFQCPACKRFSEEVEPLILKQLVDTGKAYYMFRHYAFIDQNSPLKESRRAANASLCASDQGKFWEYHDVLFANQNGENKNTFNRNRLLDFGNSIGLESSAFTSCVNDETHMDEVLASFDEGNTRGVQGTPSVFVNGQIVNPGYIPSFEEIAAAVEALQ